MTSQTGNDVISRFVDHGFLSVFHTCFASIVYRSQVICVLWEVNNGGLSTWAAKGRLTPEVTSPVDRTTTVFYSCFVDIYRLSCTVSTFLVFFLLPKMVERRFRQLGGALDRKWRHQSIPWPRFGTGRLWNFASISHRSKVIRLFRFACKMPFKNSGEGVLPPEHFFSSMRPPKGTSLWRTTSFEA
jgi:hypothetical protein